MIIPHKKTGKHGKKAIEWYVLNLRTITLDLAKEESRERILSRNEMGLLVANAQYPLKHVISVALNTGMRKAEIYNLEWVNVNLEHNFTAILIL